MEEVLKEAAKQVPALLVLCGMAYVFAKAGSSVVTAFLQQASEARTEYLKAIDRFHGENMEARAASRKTISENTEANERQSQAITELTMEVRELRSALTPVIRKLANAS